MTWTWTEQDQARFVRLLLGRVLHPGADFAWVLGKLVDALRELGPRALEPGTMGLVPTTAVQDEQQRALAAWDAAWDADASRTWDAAQAEAEELREAVRSARARDRELYEVRLTLAELVKTLEKGVQKPMGMSFAIVNGPAIDSINAVVRQARKVIPKLPDVLPPEDPPPQRLDSQAGRPPEGQVIDVEAERPELGAGAQRALPERTR